MWSVYLLSNGTRTYVGSTTDPARRLRQHNGEIVGGARSTRGKGPWHIVAYVSGFENRSVACRWERIVKCRARGLYPRLHALIDLHQGKCPGSNKRRSYPVPEGLTYITNFIGKDGGLFITGETTE